MLSACVNAASVMASVRMLRVAVVCLWAGVNCDRPIHRRQRRALRLLARSACSRPFGLCSRSEIHAEPIDSNRTVEQEPDRESIDASKHSFKRARPSSMTGAVCKDHTRRSSKFKTAVSGDDRIGGVSTPPILSYTPNLVTSRRGHFYGPSDLDADLTNFTTSRQ